MLPKTVCRSNISTEEDSPKVYCTRRRSEGQKDEVSITNPKITITDSETAIEESDNSSDENLIDMFEDMLNQFSEGPNERFQFSKSLISSSDSETRDEENGTTAD